MNMDIAMSNRSGGGGAGAYRQLQHIPRPSPSTSHHDQQPPRKRVRVSRACDECRLRKTKCDGQQPCSSCQTFERHCSFNLNQGRKPAQRTRILEDRLRRAHAHIKELQKTLPPHQRVDVDALFEVPGEDSAEEDEDKTQQRRDKSPELDIMMNRSGHMTSGTWYAGESSGFAFLLKTRELLKEESNDPSRRSSSSNGKRDGTDQERAHRDNDEDNAAYLESDSSKALVELFDAPLPEKQVLGLDIPLHQLLPRVETTSKLLRLVYDYVYPLLQFMDRGEMETRMKRIYEIDPMDYNDHDHDFVPLIYILIGLGVLFSRERHSKFGCEKAVAHAMRYYIAASKMIDITRSRTLTSLQTLICFSLFLMSTARLATAHTYSGLALASALKMGLHVAHPAAASFTDHQRDMRRRVFWTILKLNGYTSSILGLPLLLDTTAVEVTSDDLVDEVYHEALKEMGDGQSVTAYQMAASAAHFRLLMITSRATSALFSRVRPAATGEARFPKLSISSSKIVEAERQIKEWCEETKSLMSREDNNDGVLVTKYDLKMTLAFARLVLYKPFLHYLSHKYDSEDGQPSPALRLAYSCVTAAQNAIHYSNQTFGQSSNGSPSFNAVYTVFMSSIVLIFFLATRLTDGDYEKIKKDAELGIHILCSTTCQGSGASRCLDVLVDLIGHLNGVVKIDIEKIRSEAPSYCRSPPRETTKSISDPRNYAHSDADSRTRQPSANESQHAGSQRSDSHHVAPRQIFPATEAQAPDHDYLTSTHMFPVQQYESMDNMGYDHSMMFQQYPDISSEHMQFDAVHVPFDSSFSWPFIPEPEPGHYPAHIDNQQQRNTRTQSVPNTGHHTGHPMQFPMNPEDIALYLQHQGSGHGGNGNNGHDGSTGRR